VTSSFESLDNAFGIESSAVEAELIEGVDYIMHPRVSVPPVNYQDLVEFAKDPENIKRRGKAISKGKKGNKVRPHSKEANAKKSEVMKKRWAEGGMAKRKTQPRDPITGKFVGSKK
jgi:hypothetical protein